MIPKKKRPYGTTTKDPDQSIADINRLLKEYGIREYQWTTMWDLGVVELKFALEVEPGQKIGVKIHAPKFAVKRRTWNAKRGHSEVLELPNWSQSLRLTYWWLKTKLEAIAYGLTEADVEFLGDIMTKLPDGTETTYGEVLKGKIALGAGELEKLTTGEVQ